MLLKIFWNENMELFPFFPEPSHDDCQITFSLVEKHVARTLSTYVSCTQGKEWVRIAVNKGVLLAADQEQISWRDFFINIPEPSYLFCVLVSV